MKKVNQENLKIKGEKKEMQEGRDINKAPYDKLLLIDFTYGKNSLEGFLLSRNEDWSLFQYVVVDFQLDGFVIVNNKHIRKWQRGEMEIFKEKVIKSKADIITPFLKIEQLNTYQLFEQLQKQLLLQIELYRNDIVYVGKIMELRSRNFRFKKISTRVLWLEEDTYTYSSIWMIYIENDYLKSLTSYMKEHAKD